MKYKKSRIKTVIEEYHPPKLVIENIARILKGKFYKLQTPMEDKLMILNTRTGSFYRVENVSILRKIGGKGIRSGDKVVALRPAFDE